MKIIIKICFSAAFLLALNFSAFADRGGKKSKSKVMFNISTDGNFSNKLLFNLKSGLTYTGSSLLSSSFSNVANAYSESSTIITYQKGNSIYIQPAKQKILVSEIKQGYTGMKLIIRYK